MHEVQILYVGALAQHDIQSILTQAVPVLGANGDANHLHNNGQWGARVNDLHHPGKILHWQKKTLMIYQ